MARFLARRLRSVFGLGAVFCICAGSAVAFMPPVASNPFSVTAPSASRIGDIRIEGVQRLEAGTVASYLSLNKGDEATPAALDTALKALYATGLFADISLPMQGDTLVATVVDTPIQNRVAIEGNDAISQED